MVGSWESDWRTWGARAGRERGFVEKEPRSKSARASRSRSCPVPTPPAVSARAAIPLPPPSSAHPVVAIKVYLYTPVRAVLLLLDLVGVRLSKHAHGTWIGVPQHQFIEGDTCDTSMAAHWTAWGSEYSVLPDVRNGRAVRVRAASSILLAQPGPCLVF